MLWYGQGRAPRPANTRALAYSAIAHVVCYESPCRSPRNRSRECSAVLGGCQREVSSRQWKSGVFASSERVAGEALEHTDRVVRPFQNALLVAENVFWPVHGPPASPASPASPAFLPMNYTRSSIRRSASLRVQHPRASKVGFGLATHANPADSQVPSPS